MCWSDDCRRYHRRLRRRRRHYCKPHFMIKQSNQKLSQFFSQKFGKNFQRNFAAFSFLSTHTSQFLIQGKNLKLLNTFLERNSWHNCFQLTQLHSSTNVFIIKAEINKSARTAEAEAAATYLHSRPLLQSSSSRTSVQLSYLQIKGGRSRVATSPKYFWNRSF